MSEKSDAEENLDDVLISLNHVSSMIGETDSRKPLINTILNKVPLEFIERIKRRRCEVDFGTDPPNEKTLIKVCTIHRTLTATSMLLLTFSLHRMLTGGQVYN